MSHRHRRRTTSRASLFLLLLCSSSALAQSGQDDTTRAAARASGYEGIQAFENGDMVVAVDKLGRAFGVVKVPTLGLWYARALVKTGRLVEAAERYGEVVRLEATEGKIKDQKQAQAEAAAELDALKPRIPLLTLNLVGANEQCAVILDGKPVPAKLAGMAAPVNPGTHSISAKQGGEVVEQTVTIAEGEKKSIELRLKPSAGDAAKTPPPVVGTNVGSDVASTKTMTTSADSKGSAQKTIGWITLGVGGVATLAGAVTGLLAMSKRSQLDDSSHCTGTVCHAEGDRVDSLNQLRTMSTVGFVVGAVGLGVGTTLLLTTPKPKEASVSVSVGVGSILVKGSF